MRIHLQLLFIIISLSAYGQGFTCDDADPFCSDTAEIFPNTTGIESAESGPDYGCLVSTPNPAWYYMQVSVSGDISLTISQEGDDGGLDVDFICWGPFTTLDGSCNDLTSGNTIDCSYSSAAIENCNISNTQVGEFYVVLITNYSGDPGTIDFQQTSEIGETDCNILLPCFADAGTDDGYCDDGLGSTLLGGFPTASGGSNVFTYSWSPATGLDNSTIANPTATPATTTTYTVTVDDGAGCVQTDDVLITIFPDPTVLPGSTQTLGCLNDEITLDGSSSTTGTYNWTTMDGSIITSTSNTTIDVDAAGTYTLEIESDQGCIASNDVDVILGDLTAEATITGPTELCEGETGQYSITIDTPGNWAIDYSIAGIPQSSVDINGTQYDFSSGTEGAYLIDLIVNPLCTVTLPPALNLDLEETPTVTFPMEDFFFCPETSISIPIEVTGEGFITFEYEVDLVPAESLNSSVGTYFLSVTETGGYSPVSVSSENCVGIPLNFSNVIGAPEPTASFLSDYSICEGEVAQVELQLTVVLRSPIVTVLMLWRSQRNFRLMTLSKYRLQAPVNFLSLVSAMNTA